MRGILIRVGIVAAIVVVGLIIRPFISGGAGDLKVGDCFDAPTTADETVDEVQHHPCDQAHSGEVFFVGKSSASNDEAYPSDGVMTAEVFGLCDSAFTAYTGLDSNNDPTWTYGYFVPTADGWEDGDRGIICYAAKLDLSTSTGSIKQ
jgi:hypothetical protein